MVVELKRPSARSSESKAALLHRWNTDGVVPPPHEAKKWILENLASVLALGVCRRNISLGWSTVLSVRCVLDVFSVLFMGYPTLSAIGRSDPKPSNCPYKTKAGHAMARTQ
jgi:hypothetical protein